MDQQRLNIFGKIILHNDLHMIGEDLKESQVLFFRILSLRGKGDYKFLINNCD